MGILSALLWLPAMAVRLVFVLIGLVFIPITFLGDGSKRTPPLWRHIWGNVEDVPQWWIDRKSDSLFWKWWWMAVRNPTQGLAGLIKQPIPEPRPNPDEVVRKGFAKSSSRWLRSGIFSEYWYLRKVGKQYFEFRIGWNFVDGNDGFLPSLQFRLGG